MFYRLRAMGVRLGLGGIVGRPLEQGRGRSALVLLLALIIAPQAIAHPALEEQIQDLTARIERHPDDATLYLRRGDVHREHGDLAAARADYRRARRIDPALDVVALRLGWIHLDQGEPRQALAIADRRLAGRAADPAGLRLRARALTALGRHLEAAQALQQLLNSVAPPGKAGPDDYLDLARAFRSAGPGYRDRALRALDEGVAALGPIVSLQLPAIELEEEARRFEAALTRIETLPEDARRILGGLEADLRARLHPTEARREDAPPAPQPSGGR